MDPDSIIKEVIDNLTQRLKMIWHTKAPQQEILPYAVQEAVLNSLLLGSIYSYLWDKADFSSFAVSEYKVPRKDEEMGRGDLFWYLYPDTICYFEVKGSFYKYPTSKSCVNAAISYLEEAKNQVLRLFMISLRNGIFKNLKS